MKKRNLAIAGLACVMAMGGMTAVSAAEGNLPVNESGDPDPFGKYEEPITVEIIQSINPTIPLPEGDTSNDNFYTRYIKENMNIDIKVKWQASNSDYGQKLNLAIASNDIPDIMVVGEQEFKKLIKADLIEDLSPYYDTYRHLTNA